MACVPATENHRPIEERGVGHLKKALTWFEGRGALLGKESSSFGGGLGLSRWAEVYVAWLRGLWDKGGQGTNNRLRRTTKCKRTFLPSITQILIRHVSASQQTAQNLKLKILGHIKTHS